MENIKILKRLQKYSKLISESNQNKKAIIITGNPKYIKNNPDADKFYHDIATFLKKYKYDVSIDKGVYYRLPDMDSDLWIAHSRSNDVLKSALRHRFDQVKHIKMIGFGGRNISGKNYRRYIQIVNHPDERPYDKDYDTKPIGIYHYTFTDEMKKQLHNLIKSKNGKYDSVLKKYVD